MGLFLVLNGRTLASRKADGCPSILGVEIENLGYLGFVAPAAAGSLRNLLFFHRS
jgi:hypothetical protein